MSIPFLACMAAAASVYHLPPRVLPSIQSVEGGRPGLTQPNANGTADLGLMQINTTWVIPLARYTRMTPQNVALSLTYDACFSIAAAAAITRAYLNESHGNLMVAIGHYHSHTPALSAAYQQKVMNAAARLFALGQSPSR
jgi:hypothetical protein